MQLHRGRTRFPGSAVGAVMLGASAVFFFVPASLGAQDAESRPALPPQLEAVRSALERYQDPILAIHDGYFSTLACVEYPVPGGPGEVPYPAGAMGVHFLNPALLDPEPDPLRPQVLLYEPIGKTLRLVAAEWFVPLATGVEKRPVLFDQPFDGPMEGHHPLMPLGLHHYDLHVWLWKNNSAGIFSPTNPDVSCRDAPYDLPERAPKIVQHP